MNYDRISQVLHWLMAVLVLAMIFIHPSSEHGNTPSAWMLALHLHMGLLILLLVLTRIFWHWRYAKVPAAITGGKKQILAKHIVHKAFYVLMLLAPLVGLVLAVFSQYQMQLLGVIALPSFAASEGFYGGLRSFHGFGADLILYLAVIHIAVALYTQFYLKLPLLQRMTQS